MDFFTKLCARHSDMFDDTYFHIGAAQETPGDASSYFWVSSGVPIKYKLPWADGEPSQPHEAEWCLSLEKKPSQFKFNDISCDQFGRSRFICQKWESPSG